MDLRPDVATVAVNRVDGGVTVLRLAIQEYRAPDENEQLAGIVEPIPSGRPRPATAERINATIKKYIDAGVWGGPKNAWKMPATHADGSYMWEIVPNDYVDETTDKTFRNAWVHDHGKGQRKPNHDMPKAREIHRVYLRKARLAEFCRLDNDYRIADEAGDVALKASIGAERQKFRDVTEHPQIEEAKTVEELRAIRLETLVPETKGVNYMMENMKVSPSILKA